jgi:hypothetical protein
MFRFVLFDNPFVGQERNCSTHAGSSMKVWMVYSDKIYLRFEVEGDNDSVAEQPDNGILWQDDSVEILWDVGRSRSSNTMAEGVYKFAVNRAGHFYGREGLTGWENIEQLRPLTTLEMYNTSSTWGFDLSIRYEFFTTRGDQYYSLEPPVLGGQRMGFIVGFNDVGFNDERRRCRSFGTDGIPINSATSHEFSSTVAPIIPYEIHYSDDPSKGFMFR